MSQLIDDEDSQVDLYKLIDELNSQKYENSNVLVKIDIDSIYDFHFTKSIK